MSAEAVRGVRDWLDPVRRKGVVWIAVVALYLVSSAVSPAMFQLNQVFNILQVAAFLGIVAAGETIVLLTGGIDLSVAGVVTLTNIVSTSVMLGQSGNIPAAVAVSLGLALFVGALNGLLVTVLRITPLIATLGMNSILYGAALVYTGGAPHGSVSAGFEVIGQGSSAGIPYTTLCWLAISLALAWMTRKTVYGRWIYAVGANPRSASLMGAPVRPVTISAYMMSSGVAAVGGLLLTAYIGSPSLGIGNQFLLTSIAAVVVGGTTLQGGVGSVIGSVGGALLITELNSFTNIVRVSTGTQYVLQGAIIALSVLLYRLVSGKTA